MRKIYLFIFITIILFGSLLLFNNKVQAATGNIQINATFNNVPWSGPLSYTVTGPINVPGSSVPASGGFLNNVPTGQYTIAVTVHSGEGPAGAAMLDSYSPDITQTLSAGQTITFTLRFVTLFCGNVKSTAYGRLCDSSYCVYECQNIYIAASAPGVGVLNTPITFSMSGPGLNQTKTTYLVNGQYSYRYSNVSPGTYTLNYVCRSTGRLYVERCFTFLYEHLCLPNWPC